MRTGIAILITRSDRNRLKAITRDRNAPQKHVWRAAAIVLLSADGVSTNAIMRQTGKSNTCVWRWQARFMQEGVDGLLRDKTRPSRIPPLGPEPAEWVVTLTQMAPLVEASHRTAELMAQTSGISASAVRRIWKAHGLQPHRYRQIRCWSMPSSIASFITPIASNSAATAPQKNELPRTRRLTQTLQQMIILADPQGRRVRWPALRRKA
jgi:transposase